MHVVIQWNRVQLWVGDFNFETLEIPKKVMVFTIKMEDRSYRRQKVGHQVVLMFIIRIQILSTLVMELSQVAI